MSTAQSNNMVSIPVDMTIYRPFFNYNSPPSRRFLREKILLKNS